MCTYTVHVVVVALNCIVICASVLSDKQSRNDVAFQSDGHEYTQKRHAPMQVVIVVLAHSR